MVCLHSAAAHGRADGPCRVCPCEAFRWITPRHQQLQQEFGKMLAAGLRNIPLTSIPDPTAETVRKKKTYRDMETYQL